MSTRSRIGYVTKDGKIKSVYSHHDGYTSGIGKTLFYHYNTLDRIKKLIALGSINILGKYLSEYELNQVIKERKKKVLKLIGSDKLKQLEKIIDINYHIYEDDNNVSEFFHRDLQEDLNISEHDNIEDFKKDGLEHIPYGYLFKDGKWIVITKIYGQTYADGVLELKEEELTEKLLKKS